MLEVKTLRAEIDRLVTPTIESLGFELIEAEYTNEHGQWILRL